VKPRDDVSEKRSSGCRDDHVIDIEEEIRHCPMPVVDEQGRVCLGLDEAETGDMADESIKPCTRSLSESIERS
jgi:hypothetical protein